MAHLNTTIMQMVMAVDPVTVMQSLVNPRSTSSGGQMVMAIDPFAVVWSVECIWSVSTGGGAAHGGGGGLANKSVRDIDNNNVSVDTLAPLQPIDVEADDPSNE